MSLGLTRYRPSVSLDQAGCLPIPVQKGERGQKIKPRGKKGRPGRGRGNLFPDLLSPSSSFSPPLLRSTRLEQASWTLASFFVAARERSISSYLDRTSLDNHKGFLIEKENFCLRKKRGKPKRAKRPARVANQNTGFDSS